MEVKGLVKLKLNWLYTVLYGLTTFAKLILDQDTAVDHNR